MENIQTNDWGKSVYNERFCSNMKCQIDFNQTKILNMTLNSKAIHAPLVHKHEADNRATWDGEHATYCVYSGRWETERLQCSKFLLCKELMRLLIEAVLQQQQCGVLPGWGVRWLTRQSRMSQGCSNTGRIWLLEKLKVNMDVFSFQKQRAQHEAEHCNASKWH